MRPCRRAVAAVMLPLLVASAYACSAAPEQEGTGSGAQADGSVGMPGMEMEGMETEGTAMSGMSMDGSIRLTAGEIATFGITFGTVEIRPVERRVRTVGVVEFDETGMAYVSPKFGGWAERLHADFTGQFVREGQPLLDVYSPDLVVAQEELLLAARMADSLAGSRVTSATRGAHDLVESARRRLAYWDVSPDQIDRLLETGEVRRTLVLHSPTSGIVMEKKVVAGQAFRSGENLYMIADLSRVWVNAEVFEGDVGLVREGMGVEMTFGAFPGRTFHGRVEFVYPTLADRTRSVRARVSVPNPSGELKPGMYATVRIQVDLGERLSIPHSAVLQTGDRAVAFVRMADGTVMPHELTLGVAGEEYVEVLEGLELGQNVVTSAQFLLDSESNLAEVMKAMMAQMNMSDLGGMGGMEGMEGMEGMGGGR